MDRTRSPDKGAKSYYLRKEHESQKKILNNSVATRFSLHCFVKRVEKLTSDQRAAIEKVGFGNLLQLPNCNISKTLIAELIDKWSSEKHAFLIGDREISISPLDVALIMGLRVKGKPVTLKDKPLLDCEDGYVNSPSKRRIAVATLEENLDRGEDDEAEFIRTFLLYTFGVFLFPNSSRVVDGRYVWFLRDLDAIKEYAWGSALLEHLITWITARKDDSKEYIGGCLLFLQIWSYEHFDVARPNTRFNSLAFPRACRWEKSKVIPRSKLTKEFEKLSDDKIIWELQPTAIELKVDIIKEVLAARTEPQEIASQSGMANLSMHNDINAEMDSLVDKMDRVHIFDALKVPSLPTDIHYPSQREEGDLLGKIPIVEETNVELVKKMREMNLQLNSHAHHSGEQGSEMQMFWNCLYNDSGFDMSWNKLYEI